jgi:hypothetical protein
MSGRPFLWTRQKAGRLSGWRICSGSTRLMDAHLARLPLSGLRIL